MQHNHRNTYLSVCLFLFICTNVFGADVKFRHLGIKDGLSQNSVSAIYQDSLQRMWFGTRDGLNIYDGTSFKTLRPVIGDSTTLLGHFVIGIAEESKTKIWVVTKNGVSRMNIATLQFEQFPFKDCMAALPYQGKLLVGTKSGLYILNPSSKKVHRATNMFNNKCVVNSIHLDSDGNVWIGSQAGTYIYSPISNQSTCLLPINTTHISTDSNGLTWVGSYEDGAFLFDEDNKLLKQFSSHNTQNTLAHNNIRDINEDVQGRIWVATFNGLSIINPKKNYQISNCKHSNADKNSLSHNSVLNIYADEQGTMWLGTYFGGVNYYDTSAPLFNIYDISENQTNKYLGFNIVGEMLEDDNGNIWIASEGKGIDHYNRTTGTFEHYPDLIPNKQKNNVNVKALAKFGTDKLLIGTHLDGLIIFDIKTTRTQTIRPLGGDIVEDIIPLGEHYLLATNKGVVLFDTEKNTFTNYISNNKTGKEFSERITCLKEDSYGNLWIGTLAQGLYMYNNKTKQLNTYQSVTQDSTSISSNSISCIYEDHYFRLWVGTHGGGLNLYQRHSDSFVYKNTHNSNIPGNFIQGIEKSRQGNIWIMSTNGISLYDIDTNNFSNYSRLYNFPLSELNHRALLVCNNGEVYVGGTDGLISFNEQKLINYNYRPNLILSSIEVNGEPISPTNNSRILPRDLPYTHSITLKPHENLITINYSSCNYHKYSKSNYRYKLEKLHTEWIYATKKPSITYSKLSPGSYKLIVQTVGTNDKMVLDQTQLKITVNAPLYQKWYAYLAYICTVLFIIGWFVRLYKNRLQMRNNIISEQKEKEQLQALTQSKLNFFTNISHEFRTPLTLINSTLEAIYQNKKTSPENVILVKNTMQNTKRLNNLIDELLDFRKIESDHLKLKIQNIDIDNFLSDICATFAEYAHQRNINFEIQSLHKHSELWIDPKQMEKVFYNLISNAFKFVDVAHGNIVVALNETDEKVEISITDNGVGMHVEELENIFNLYYQVDQINQTNNAIGSGVGLALSRSIVLQHKGNISVESNPNQGATFTVSLLKGKEHLQNCTFDTELHAQSSTEQIEFIPKIEQTITQPATKEGLQTLLIVEDNEEIRNLLLTLFQNSMNVLLANNGKNGVEMAINNDVDIIISDIMMPVMSGTEMCQILKRNIRTSHIPIVLLTAKADIQSQLQGLEIGADDYISKPFNSQLLVSRVRNIVENRIRLQNKYKTNLEFELTEITTSGIDQEMLRKAEEIIYKHIDNEAFNIHDFAIEMGMSRSSLHQKIKAITGQTPNELIVSTRLKKAAEMILQNNNMYIAEIAYRVGYSDPKYFGRSFKKHFGVSPKSYTNSPLK